MYIVPPKMLNVTITNVVIKSYWNQSNFAGDKFSTKPYQWTTTFNVTTQFHSSQKTRLQNQYNGQDISVGDWVCSGLRGVAHKIISISSATNTSVTAVLEDYDRFNTIFDSGRQGNGAPQKGPGFCFEIDEYGMPIIIGSNSGVIAYPYVTDLMARFQYRNYVKSHIRVYQENNTFSIGDMIYLDSTGNYQAIIADKDNRDNLNKVVGTVTDISIPGKGYFTWKPRGEYISSLDIELPECDPGSLIYIDTENAGKLTATAPKIYAIPVYIRLSSSTEAIYLMGGSGSGGSSSPLGYNTATYIVDDLTARDALDTTLMNPGDQVYVKNNDNNLWALYIAADIDETKAVPVVTWEQLTDTDSSNTDSGTVQYNLTYQTPNETDLVSVKANVRVSNIIVEVTEVFSSDATLTIGDDAVANRLVGDGDIDLTVLSSYTIMPNYQYPSLTTIKAILNPGASFSGKAIITLSYS